MEAPPGPAVSGAEMERIMGLVVGWVFGSLITFRACKYAMQGRKNAMRGSGRSSGRGTGPTTPPVPLYPLQQQRRRATTEAKPKRKRSEPETRNQKPKTKLSQTQNNQQ